MARADHYPADSRDEDDAYSGGDYPERRSALHQRRADAVPRALGLHMVHGAAEGDEPTTSLRGLHADELDALLRYQREQAGEGPTAA